MFQSIIHEADISLNSKMQHLQNSVIGKAKEAIEGCGYTGEFDVTALEKLESRFGKSHIAVKAHLNRLRRWGKLCDERLCEVRRFSDVVSTATNAFKRLGYIDDLRAANNLNMVVEKLSHSLSVKWKEYKRDKNLIRANLLDFSKWIEVQAEIYDEFGTRTKPQPVQTDVRPRSRSSGTAATYSTVTNPVQSAGSSMATPGGHFSGTPCIMGDSKYHKLYNCPKFKELSVQDRLVKNVNCAFVALENIG
jgi:hypothetical protein